MVRLVFVFSVLMAAGYFTAPAMAQSSQSLEVSGFCPGPQAVSFDVDVDFVPTGGDFNAGTGTATVTFRLENSSGLYPFQAPAMGNPILTGFYFNVPSTAGVTYSVGRALAGGTLFSSGTNINGVPVPPGCTVLGSDVEKTDWYQLISGASTGQYGLFTNGIGTEEGVKAGLVDPSVFVGCVPQGDVFSPVVIAGPVEFEVLLTNLDTSLDTAQEFSEFCSIAPGDQEISSFAGKMQGTGVDGEESCFLGLPCPVPVDKTSWGAIKVKYQ